MASHDGSGSEHNLGSHSSESNLESHESEVSKSNLASHNSKHNLGTHKCGNLWIGGAQVGLGSSKLILFINEVNNVNANAIRKKKGRS